MLAVIEIMAVAFFPDLAGYRDAFAFFLLIVILLIKPTDLMGERLEDKVSMRATRNALLNGLAVLALGLFIWWADENLDGYSIQILNLIAVNIILAVSLNLINGITGLFSLGHAGFMAIGAYVCSTLILAPEQKDMLFILEPAYDWVVAAQAPFFLAVVAGGLVASLFAVIVGIPLLRLGDDDLGRAQPGVRRDIRADLRHQPAAGHQRRAGVQGHPGLRQPLVELRLVRLHAGVPHPPDPQQHRQRLQSHPRRRDRGQGHGRRRLPGEAPVLHHRGVLRRSGRGAAGESRRPRHRPRRCSPSS